jgi:hypothetical protein
MANVHDGDAAVCVVVVGELLAAQVGGAYILDAHVVHPTGPIDMRFENFDGDGHSDCCVHCHSVNSILRLNETRLLKMIWNFREILVRFVTIRVV